MALILDTGPLYASLDRDDVDHATCRLLIQSSSERLVIPSSVLVEVKYLARQRLRSTAVTAFLDDVISGYYAVEDLVPEDYARIRELLAQYADARIGFVDAAVLAIVERLGEPKLATLDRRHFGMLRPRHLEALTLLPE